MPLANRRRRAGLRGDTQRTATASAIPRWEAWCRIGGMIFKHACSLAAAAMALASIAAAQAPPPQERVAALKESLARNQAALKRYSWVETTVISMKGEVKKQQQKQCSYGADGKVQKTPIGEQAPKAKEPSRRRPPRRPREAGRRREKSRRTSRTTWKRSPRSSTSTCRPTRRRSRPCRAQASWRCSRGRA